VLLEGIAWGCWRVLREAAGWVLRGAA